MPVPKSNCFYQLRSSAAFTLVEPLVALASLLFASLPTATSAGVILSDSFSYPDGPLVTVSNARWKTHSGSAGQVEVAGARIKLTQAESEDVSSLLDGQPYGPASGANLYARFTVSFNSLPSGDGTYFAHFKDNTATGFRCRVFATTNAAASGSFRLGISAATNTPTTLPTDLSLNTDYLVVVELSTSDSVSTLWLNPVSETDANAVSADAATPLNLAAFAFRQSSSGGDGIGALTVDDLIVGTSFSDVLNAGGRDGPPVITSQPLSQTVVQGQVVTFSVGVVGAGPLTYQWHFNGGDLAGATNASLSLSNVTTNQAGSYLANISNALGSTNSDPAVLWVVPAPSAVVTNIAYLHALVDPVNYRLTDTNTLFQVEGIVTTHNNLSTAGSALFYIQDDSSGIAVSVNGGAAVPPARGDLLRVTGPLGQLDGLLEMNLSTPNPAYGVVTISSGNRLPEPTPLDFRWQDDPSVIEPQEGKYMVVSNVFLDLSNGSTFMPDSIVTMTNQSGETFALRIDARVTDLIGQPKPTTAVTIYGVLSQLATSDPRTTGYQLLPSSLADLVLPRLPTVRYTNTLSNLSRAGDTVASTNLTEYALRPSETITIETVTTDGYGRQVTIQPQTNGLPAGASWAFRDTTGRSVAASLTFSPGVDNAGTNYPVVLLAINDDGTNAATWNIYVPTPDEQRFYIAEFLANPTTNPASPNYNPLHRATPSPADKIATEDEYVELVNLSPDTIELTGWTLSDGVAVRHRFIVGDAITSSNAVVVDGGRAFGSPPNLPAGVLSFDASESSAGLGLNNNGDTLIVRNGSGHLVERVVYSQSMLSNDSSLTRSPDWTGPFVAHSAISTNYVSPGTQPDGRAFSEPATIAPPAIVVGATPGAGPFVVLHWSAEPGRAYSVLQAAAVTDMFTPLTNGLRFPDDKGQFTDNDLSGVRVRFYLITTP